jgi:hypothetical protein
MSKKHMGSSVDDFLKEEGIFEEAQAQAVKEVVAWQLGHEKGENLEKQDGDASEDEPYASRPAPQCEGRHHTVEPSAGGDHCRSPRHD